MGGDKFEDVCTFSGEAAPSAVNVQHGPNGAFRIAHFAAVLDLGGTELGCHLEWEERLDDGSGVSSVPTYRPPIANLASIRVY